MANTFRYLRGDTNPIRVPVASADVIEIGDVVVRDASDSNTYIDATDAAYWDTDEATTKGNLKDEFVGIALQASASGETEPIAVATSGVFEFPAESDTYLLGKGVGLEKDTGNNLKLSFVDATDALAFARVAKQEDSAATTIEAEIFSSVARQGLTTPTT